MIMGSKAPSVPTPPSAAETTKQSIQAQIESLPEILKAQQQYGGQFAQTALDLNKQYAPELYKQTQEMYQALNPEMVAGQNVLKQYLSQEDLLNPEELRQAREDARSAYGVRGMGGSGMAAQQELIDLTKLRQSLKTQRLNTALSVMGLQPIQGQTSVSQPQLVQNVNPSDIFGLTQNAYNSQMNAYGQTKSAQIKGSYDMWGSIIGGTTQASGSIAGAAIGMSDKRLKNNIKYITKIGNHKLATWTWNTNAKRYYGYTGKGFGLIAQDVKLYCPNSVKEDNNGYLTINYILLGE